MSIKLDFSLEPKEAIAYLKNKGYKITFDYTEMQKSAHNKAFTVAKVTRLDLLKDIHDAVTHSIKDGKTFQEFKKQLLPILQEKGWWGKKTL
jgi:uncharacterized protein with gpF-like domain